MAGASAQDRVLGTVQVRPSATFLTIAVLLGALVVWGVYGYAQQRLHGDIVTGLRTVGAGGAVWGLYITFDIVFVGLAFTGIAISAIARIFRLREMRPYSRPACLLAVVSLMMAGLCVVADLGRPLHGLLNLPKYARTMSPFFGTFTMVIGAGLTASLVVLFLAGRADAAVCARVLPRFRWLYRLWASGYKNTEHERVRHRVASILLSLVILPLMVIAYSTLGIVFGVQSGRPGWFSALQAPGFVVLAALTGTGLLLFVAGALGRWMGLGESLPMKPYIWLSNTMWVLLLLFLYFMAVEEITARYAAMEVQTEVAKAIDSGPYAPLFWSMLALMVGCFLVLFVQFVRRRYSVPTIMTVGLLVNVAGILKRMLIVVPSQTHGTLLAYPAGVYWPTWVEVSVILGLISLGTLIFMVFLKMFPVLPMQTIGPVHLPEVPVFRPLRRLVRVTTFWVTLLTGLTLTYAGFMLSARFGTEPYLDPIVPYSPMIFIAGVTLSLGSAVVYELFPPSRPPQDVAVADA